MANAKEIGEVIPLLQFGVSESQPADWSEPNKCN